MGARTVPFASGPVRNYVSKLPADAPGTDAR